MSYLNSQPPITHVHTTFPQATLADRMVLSSISIQLNTSLSCEITDMGLVYTATENVKQPS